MSPPDQSDKCGSVCVQMCDSACHDVEEGMFDKDNKEGDDGEQDANERDVGEEGEHEKNKKPVTVSPCNMQVL